MPMHSANQISMKKQDKEQLRAIAEKLGKSLLPLIEEIRYYHSLSYRTPEEEASYQEMVSLIRESLPVITLLKDFFGNEAMRASEEFYFHLKKLAGEGDTKASEILCELSPLYQQSLLEQLNNN